MLQIEGASLSLLLSTPAIAGEVGAVVSAFIEALLFVMQPEMLLFVLIGVVVGLIFGAVPGVGGVVALSLLIAVTFHMPADQVMLLFAATLGGTAFGGSITAILMNIPGQSTNAATILDGYPMTQQGKGAEALGASATASALGAIVGLGLLVLLMPFLFQIVLLFGPAEMFTLGLLGLSVIAAITAGSTLNGMIAAGVGLLTAFIGLNPLTGEARFTLDSTYLLAGVELIPVLIGLFAIGEALRLAVEDRSVVAEDVELSGSVLNGVKSVFTNKMLFFRSSIIGVVVGMVPAVGGTVANFIAYVQAKQQVKDDNKFGSGDIRGVIAPEAANDSKDGGALIPTLGLGIPGSAAMAVLLGAFVLHGVAPGPRLLSEGRDLVFIIIIGLVIANVFTSVIGILSANQLVKITKIRIEYLLPMIFAVSFIGAYAVNTDFMDIIMVLVWGIIGFHMIMFNFSRIALIIAFILGPIIEQQFWTALQIGGPTIFFTEPIALFFLLLTVVSLIFSYRFEPQDVAT